MKKTVIILLTLFTVLITSCGSTKIKPVREPDETFLADIDAIELDSVNCFTAYGKMKANITEIYFHAIPRTNDISVTFRLGIDNMNVFFSYKERQKLKESFDKYLLKIQDSKLENRKATKKNSFFTGVANVNWGVGAPSHSADAEYFANYEFLEPNKPYYKLQFYSADEPEKENISSPFFSVYLTPAQIRKIIEICNQDKIQEEVDKVLKEAYTFDTFEYNYSDSEQDTPAFAFDDEENYIDAK